MIDELDPLARLKRAVDSGYYAIDSTPTDTTIPWAGKTCGDCPFFVTHNLHSSSGRCVVQNKTVSIRDETCAYFDPCNHDEGAMAITKRSVMTMPQWEAWFKDGRIPIDAEPMGRIA